MQRPEPVPLHHVQDLFLDLLQLVLHLHYNLLHFGMIGLAAQRIDFAAHFLCDEAQLLTLFRYRFRAC